MEKVGSTSTMLALGANFARSVQEITPVDSGALRASVGVRAALPKLAIVGAGNQVADYARAVEYGTEERVITPRRARRLAFFWDKQNRMFWGRVGQSVRHPAQPAQPFVRPVLATFNAALPIKAEIVKRWNDGA